MLAVYNENGGSWVFTLALREGTRALLAGARILAGGGFLRLLATDTRFDISCCVGGVGGVGRDQRWSLVVEGGRVISPAKTWWGSLHVVYNTRTQY